MENDKNHALTTIDHSTQNLTVPLLSLQCWDKLPHWVTNYIPTLRISQQPASSNLIINSPVSFSIVWGSQLLPCANQLDLKTWGKESKVKRLSWKLIQQCMAGIECWPPTHMFTFHCSTWCNSYPNYNDNHCTSWNTELYMKWVMATWEVATWLCDFHSFRPQGGPGLP